VPLHTMPTGLRRFLIELREHDAEHDAAQEKHADTFRNLETEKAEFISVLIRASKRRRILEIGTSNGYSTLWISWSAGQIGDRVTSVEANAGRQELANENLRQAGLRSLVDLKLGDATEVAGRLSGPFDLVFFDADRISAPSQLRTLLPKLAPDAMLLADNVLSHPEEISGYLAAIEELDDFDSFVVPIGKGLSVAYRGPENPGIQ